MAKLSPPSPQNPKKRTMFFLAHPNHPRAAAWMAQVQNKLAKKAYDEYVRQLKDGGGATLEAITKEMTQKYIGMEEV